MHKKILAVCISLTIVINQVFVATVANAAPSEAIENSNVQIKQLDKQIVDLNAQMSTLNTEINKLNDTLNKNGTEMKNTENKIKDTEVNISETKNTISQKENVLGERLRGMYKSDVSSNPLLLVLSSESFSDLLNKSEAMVRIITFDKKFINDLDTQRLNLNNQINDLNKKQTELKELKNSTEQSLKEVKDKQSEKKGVLDKFNEEKKHYLSIIEENENSLIAHSVSIINSSNSIDELNNAVTTLKQLLPSLSASSVKNKAEDAINTGTSKISKLQTPSSKGSSNGGNSGGSTTAKKTYTMEATAYSDGLITASGSPPRRDPSGLSTVAVDPSVIPLGSKLYIPGYGLAIANDTGGDIKGMRIDLYMNSESECNSFGRQSVSVQVLAYTGEW